MKRLKRRSSLRRISRVAVVLSAVLVLSQTGIAAAVAESHDLDKKPSARIFRVQPIELVLDRPGVTEASTTFRVRANFAYDVRIAEIDEQLARLPDWEAEVRFESHPGNFDEWTLTVQANMQAQDGTFLLADDYTGETAGEIVVQIIPLGARP